MLIYMWKSIYINIKHMLFSFLQKQKNIRTQKKLIETIIQALNISEEQKNLYIQALEVLDIENSEKLYKNLIIFVEQIELREIEAIRKDSFSSIAGMRKKEINEKAQELNGFSFLLHNL